VVAPDRVMVADRRAGGDDRVAGGDLGRLPLLELGTSLLAGEKREVQRRTGRVQVRHVTHDASRGAAGIQRLARRGASPMARCVSRSSLHVAAVSSVSTSTSRVSSSSRR